MTSGILIYIIGYYNHNTDILTYIYKYSFLLVISQKIDWISLKPTKFIDPVFERIFCQSDQIKTENGSLSYW